MNNPARKIRPDTVGELFVGIEGKIADDGEILLRGPAIMDGYFNLPEATADALDPEGWFHTGDIGEFDDGYLKITDRKKDLLVLGNGKNVAPQPIENKLRSSAMIEEAVVLGDGMDSCIALIVPNYALFRQRLGEELSDEEISKHDEVVASIKAEVKAINRTLAGFEQVKKHALLGNKFSIEGGELTPTLKVRRRVVSTKYASVIEGLVGSSEEAMP